MPPSPASARARLAHGFEHGNEVVTVHLQAVQAAGQALLRQRLRTGLRRAWHRDRPAVVDHAQDQRQRVGTGRVERGVEVGLGAAAIAAARHRHLRLALQLERQRRAGRVQALGGNRHADREVDRRIGIAWVVAAALVAAPVQQHIAWTHAAFEHGAVLTVAGREHIAAAHRGTDAHMGGLVAQAGGVGAELAGALQRDRLAVEGAHEQHALEQREQLLRVGGVGRQVVADDLAVRIHVLQIFDLELRGYAHCGDTFTKKFQMI